MKFEALKDQAIGDRVVAALVASDLQNARTSFSEITDEGKDSNAGLFLKHHIELEARDSDSAYDTAKRAALEHRGANWAVDFVATVCACKGADRTAVTLLTTRHEPPLHDWVAELIVAQKSAVFSPERGRMNFAAAVQHCPKQHLEFLVESALDCPPLAAVLHKKEAPCR